jgi:uncharacterized protein (DUF58 family)
MRPVQRFLYWLYRVATGAGQWVRRRFTRAGMSLLGGVVVTGLMGLDVYGSVSYQAFLMLLCLLGVSLAWSWRFRLPFSAQRALPRFGTVGVPLTYSVRLSAQSSHPQKGLLLSEDLADARPSLEEFIALRVAAGRRPRSFHLARGISSWNLERAQVQEGQVGALDPGHEAEVRLRLTPRQRGCIRFTGLNLARPDPLGLFKALVRCPLPQSLLVLPRRYPLPPLALPGVMKYQPGGVAQASSVGESEEFVALRDYRRGDPLRRIHWRSWARAGRPIVKEYQDEFFVRHALILDTFSLHHRGEVFEEAVSVAASFACSLQTQESLLDLLFVGAKAYCFTSGRGLAHTDQMLEILASVQTCHDKPFQVLESLVLNHIGAVSGCVCVLVDWDESRRQLVGRLRQLGVPLKVLVVTDGTGPAPEPGPLREAPQDFHVLTAGRVAEGLARL